jgi:hypothetical protein
MLDVSSTPDEYNIAVVYDDVVDKNESSVASTVEFSEDIKNV